MCGIGAPNPLSISQTGCRTFVIINIISQASMFYHRHDDSEMFIYKSILFRKHGKSSIFFYFVLDIFPTFLPAIDLLLLYKSNLELTIFIGLFPIVLMALAFRETR